MATIERALEKIRKGAAASGNSRRIARLNSRAANSRAGTESSRQALAKSTHKHVEFDLQIFSDSGLVSPGNHRISEEYRLIKQPILKKATETIEGEKGFNNLLMISSALPGEGKTFTSVNLSLSLAAERDWEVLLVDTDCKNPQLSRLLGVAEEPGLLDLLKDPELKPEDLILGTNIDGLSVLPVGQSDIYSPELIASERMAELCRELARFANGRVITLFDSSPLLMTSESPILSGYVGQVGIVVRANSTPQQAVAQALEKLDDAPAVGLILNGSDGSEDALAYGNYHAYGSSYGATH
jgi:exopolysaccharide/PEP-CTERM locus tyrosine autokinase